MLLVLFKKCFLWKRAVIKGNIDSEMLSDKISICNLNTTDPIKTYLILILILHYLLFRALSSPVKPFFPSWNQRGLHLQMSLQQFRSLQHLNRLFNMFLKCLI